MSPERDISDIIREGRFVEYMTNRAERYKNIEFVNPVIYEKIRDNIFDIFRDSNRLSVNVLKKRIKTKFGVSADAELKRIIKQLYLDGYLVKRRKGRKVYYELIDK